MATFRKRKLKNSVVYDIQVKFKEPNSNQTIVKTMVWHPEHKMTDRQAERECALVAQKFESDVRQLYTGSVADVPDYNITVGQMADKWLERVRKDFSVAYYESIFNIRIIVNVNKLTRLNFCYALAVARRKSYVPIII